MNSLKEQRKENHLPLGLTRLYVFALVGWLFTDDYEAKPSIIKYECTFLFNMI